MKRGMQCEASRGTPPRRILREAQAARRAKDGDFVYPPQACERPLWGWRWGSRQRRASTRRWKWSIIGTVGLRSVHAVLMKLLKVV